MEPKNKTQSYENLQGLNEKVSRYITGETEFLRLQNVDARVAGSLSSTPGSTQWLTTGVSSPITGIADAIVRGNSYGMGFGSPTHFIVATTQYDAGNISTGSYQNFYTFLYPGNSNQMSFVKTNGLFAANQNDFFAYPSQKGFLITDPTLGAGNSPMIVDFSEGRQFSLPKPRWDLRSFSGSGRSGASNANGLTGIVTVAAAFERSDGFIGPASFVTFLLTNGFTQLVISPFPTFEIYPGPTTTPTVGVTTFNISGIWIWYNDAGLFPTQRNNQSYLAFPQGATFIFPPSSGAIEDGIVPENFQGTYLYGFNEPDNLVTSSDFGVSAVSNLQLFNSNNPSTIALFNNVLWSAGFFNFPDSVYFSNPGELEKSDLLNNFDFNALDGDKVTCLTPYFTQLVIFKTNSIGALTGSTNDDINVTTVTNQYGCLSTQGAAVFEQRLWFLDKKGICEYNGANTSIVSNKLEPTFKRLNIGAAPQVASLVHVKELNQVQCFIPVDGATYCNLLVFYDYLANFWGERSINQASTGSNLTLGSSQQMAYYGDNSGMIYNFGPSFSTNNGSAFTCVIQSRFIPGDGNFSTEKQFRRLYLDATIPPGSTYNFLVNLYADFGSSAVHSATMTLSNHQNRIDFGVPASAMSVELIYSEGNFLQLNGFSVEWRFQRMVSVEQNNGEAGNA